LIDMLTAVAAIAPIGGADDRRRRAQRGGEPRHEGRGRARGDHRHRDADRDGAHHRDRVGRRVELLAVAVDVLLAVAEPALERSRAATACGSSSPRSFSRGVLT
jgi:hypothetical protein